MRKLYTHDKFLLPSTYYAYKKVIINCIVWLFYADASVRIVGGQSDQYFVYRIKLKLRVDAVENMNNFVIKYSGYFILWE